MDLGYSLIDQVSFLFTYNILYNPYAHATLYTHVLIHDANYAPGIPGTPVFVHRFVADSVTPETWDSMIPLFLQNVSPTGRVILRGATRPAQPTSQLFSIGREVHRRIIHDFPSCQGFSNAIVYTDVKRYEETIRRKFSGVRSGARPLCVIREFRNWR